jgi:nucleotide-binding universal stress UspA family protein
MISEETAHVLAPKLRVDRRRAPWTVRREAVRDASGVNIANGAGQGLAFAAGPCAREHVTSPIAATFRIGKILFPIDFSERCSQVSHAATVLTRRFDAELTLAHVHPFCPEQSVPSERGQRSDSTPNGLRSSQAMLERFQRSALEGLNLKRIVVQEDDPGRSIVELARAHHADLILMPTYGGAPFRKLILGSVTEKVLQRAHCPVWTSPHREERVNGGRAIIRKVVCAIDRNSRAQRVLEWVRDLTRALGAALTVVHAISPYHRASESRWSEDLRRDAEAALHRRLDELGLSAGVHVERGEVTQVVSSVIENLDADLLTIGKCSENGGFGSLVTNSYSLIRHSNCPVVSV